MRHSPTHALPMPASVNISRLLHAQAPCLRANSAGCCAGPRKRLRTCNTSWGTANGQQLERELERSLREFVRLRTVSSDASLREDCFRGAKFLASLLESLGARTAGATSGRLGIMALLAPFSGFDTPCA